MRASPLLLIPLFALGCPSSPEPVDDGPAACEYPAGAVEPMEFGEVLSPYSWATALEVGGDGSVALELEDVPCEASDEIDWSPFDVLLFVSIPAW